MTIAAKTLSACQRDATLLHGLLQGLEILIEQSAGDASPAGNAAYSLASEVVAKSDALAADLCRLQGASLAPTLPSLAAHKGQ